MNNQVLDVSKDIADVEQIAIIPFILETVCRTTGMGFAAVARVTPERWIAYAVNDEIKFGMVPGGELKIDTTICHEIRQSGKPVIIDDVSKDEAYCLHATPAMYGFRSYISVPILSADGTFFGTLCAIDPKPSILNTPEITAIFRVFSNLISFLLNAVRNGNGVLQQKLEHIIIPQLKDLLAEAAAHPTDNAVPFQRNNRLKAQLLDCSAKITQLLTDVELVSAE